MSTFKVLCPHCNEPVNLKLDLRRIDRRTMVPRGTEGTVEWLDEIGDFVRELTETSIPAIGAHLGFPDRFIRSPVCRRKVSQTLRALGWVPFQYFDGTKVLRRWKPDKATELNQRDFVTVEGDDLWDAPIRDYLEQCSENVSLAQVATGALHLDVIHQTELAKRRIMATLKKLGWEHFLRDDGRTAWRKGSPKSAVIDDLPPGF